MTENLGQADALAICALGISKDFERAVRSYQQITKDGNDFLVWKGLIPLEAYVEGRLRILLRLKNHIGTKVEDTIFLDLRAECRQSCVPLNDSAAGQSADVIRDVDFRHCRDENHMLVGDVELVKAVEPLAIPTQKRFYRIDDSISHSLTRTYSRRHMSIDGTFKRVPILPEGEKGMPSWQIPVGLDANTVSVIQGGPKVMDRIANYCRRVFGEVSADNNRLVPVFLLCLTAENITVFSNVSAENTFQLDDVMFGPFSF